MRYGKVMGIKQFYTYAQYNVICIVNEITWSG